MLKFFASPEKLAFWRYALLILRRRYEHFLEWSQLPGKNRTQLYERSFTNTGIYRTESVKIQRNFEQESVAGSIAARFAVSVAGFSYLKKILIIYRNNKHDKSARILPILRHGKLCCFQRDTNWDTFFQFYVSILPIYPPRYLIQIFTHLKLCLANATHDFKWGEITHICLIWDQKLKSWCLNTHFVHNISGIFC